jgi:hypothetical protein
LLLLSLMLLGIKNGNGDCSRPLLFVRLDSVPFDEHLCTPLRNSTSFNYPHGEDKFTGMEFSSLLQQLLLLLLMMMRPSFDGCWL